MDTEAQSKKHKKERPIKVTEYIVTETFTGKKDLKELLLNLMIKDIKNAKSG